MGSQKQGNTDSKRLCLRGCDTGRFATRIFSVTQRCNAGTML